MNIRRVHVNVSSPYDVTIGKGLLNDCGTIIREIQPACTVAVISDTNVAPLYLDRVIKSLESAGFKTCSFVFPAGERSKNMSTLSEILEFLAENRLTRSDCLIALGGGVVGDITGFAAGCYLRGLPFVQLPTTFLAAVDSSVGGKTAVDLNGGKNLAGLFIQPSAVICDTDCMSTLSDEIFADGTAEAIKTGILNGEELFSIMESGDIKANLDYIVEKCVCHKAAVVEEDEFETGLRRTLNLGHTVGHAIEKCSNYEISHGHAVAIGTAIIARAAVNLGFTERECAERIITLLEKNGLPTCTVYSADQLTDAALSDKKRAGSVITMIIPRNIGECAMETILVTQLTHFISAGLEK